MNNKKAPEQKVKCGYCHRAFKESKTPECIYVVPLDRYFCNQNCLTKLARKENLK